MSSWEIPKRPRVVRQVLIVTKPVVPGWLRGGACQRLADVKDPLENRENSEHRQHIHSWREKVDVEDASPLREHQPNGEDYYPDRARSQPALVLDAQRLGAGARVAHHQRPEDGEHGGGYGEVHAARGEVRGDGGQDDALFDPVERRIEKGAERRALAGHARVAAVERVHDRADDERDAGEEEVALRDEHGRDDVQREPRHRDHVRSQARLDERVACAVAYQTAALRRAQALASAAGPAAVRHAHASGRTRPNAALAVKGEEA